MMEKYRVHEVAKDLGVPSKEVVELLAKHYPDSPKNHMAALERDELSVVLDHYSQKFQVEDMDTYFAEGRKRREEAEKVAVEAEKKPEPKKESVPMQKEPVKKPEAKKEEPPVAKKPIEKVAAPKEEKKEHTPKPVPQKTAEKPVAKQETNKKPAEKKPITNKVVNSPNKQKEQVIQTVEDINGVKRVDMRTVKVNLDKYNERYETIAPESMTQKPARKPPNKNQQRKRNRNGKIILSRQEKEAQKKQRVEMEKERRSNLAVELPQELSVVDFANRMNIQVGEIVKRLMGLGIMASAGEIIDYDTAALVALEIGATVTPEVVVTIEDRLFEMPEEDEVNLKSRPPVVVVMGHVDHGKTSTLDAIRKTQVTSGEAGGITQHIGAYQVIAPDGRKITFLDTPGHAAFTSMRSRGAQITDVAIIVVAADDGIMPQTVEAINHAKDAEVSIIVAINKMDKPDANPDRVMQELTEHGLVPEAWGGDIICVNISAKTGEGLDELLEMVQLSADVLELKANPNRQAQGTVIEARLEKGRGAVTTLLVQNGTLNTNDYVIAGTAIGRVRAMVNDLGETVETASPSAPVEIIGLSEAPQAGDIFNVVENERLARELADQRRHEAKEEIFSSYQKVTLDNLFDQISEGEMKELRLIVKADVQGSVEAVTQSLQKIVNDEVRVRVIHGGVGAVNESDISLAAASNAIIVGFNVRPDLVAREMAKREEVDVRLYRVIYDAIDEITDAMKGMREPKTREIELGSAEVRDIFKVSNVGTIAGCYVTEGKITRTAEIRVVRDGVIIADDTLKSLRRFTDDVKEVAQNYECGIGLEKFNDLKVGDRLEAYEIEEYRD